MVPKSDHPDQLRRRSNGLWIAMSVLCIGLAASGAQAAETSHSASADSGIETWETDTDGVHLRLTQITPDQARAFMAARGLDKKSVDDFVHHCVFMAVLRNDSKHPINYCLMDWRYVPEAGVPEVMLTKHDWLATFRNRDFSPQARLAFEWSQFPVEQTFSPGDWNQGMLTFDLAPGSHFDLVYRWRQKKKLHEGRLQNVQCAPSAADS
jgi:hypothetical protein